MDWSIFALGFGCGLAAAPAFFCAVIIVAGLIGGAERRT